MSAMSTKNSAGMKKTEEQLDKVKMLEPEYSASVLKNMLLVFDQVTVIIFGIVSAINSKNEEFVGRTSVILFSVTSTVVLLTAIAYFIYKMYDFWKSSHQSKNLLLLPVIIYASVASGAVLYYVGDNLTSASVQFDAFGCGVICLENIEVSSRIFLFVALTCFRLLPFLVNKCWRAYKKPSDNKPSSRDKGENIELDELGDGSSPTEPTFIEMETTCTLQQVGGSNTGEQSGNDGEQENKTEDQGKGASNGSKKPSNEQKQGSKPTDFQPSSFGLVMLSLLIEVDAIYTAVWQEALAVNENNTNGTITIQECKVGDVVVTSVSIGTICLAWAVFTPLFLYYKLSAGKRSTTVKKTKIYWTIFVVDIILIMLYPITYLLADNTYPLACYPESEPSVRYSLLTATLTMHFLIVAVFSARLKMMELNLMVKELRQIAFSKVVHHK